MAQAMGTRSPKLLTILLHLVILLSASALAYASSQPLRLHHEMKIVFEPEARTLVVTDRLTFPHPPQQSGVRKLHLLLRAGLTPTATSPGVSIVREREGGRSGIQARYTVSLPPGARTLSLTYGGSLPKGSFKPEATATHPPSPEKSHRGEAGRVFLLTGEDAWYPDFEGFEDDLLTFTLEVDLPEPWEAISQGSRTLNMQSGGRSRVRWESPQPQQEITLAIGHFTEYRERNEPVATYAFLRTPDRTLAQRYLKAADGYLKMYSTLIGPYPYKKFALVENDRETGWGFPSYTLIGSRILRLPFILHTSFPHEILHDWWGNGVFVDLKSGNWCEGLTAYLADHLLRERAGAGAEYRRATLQKYANYVSKRDDFPLAKFRARHDDTTQAVGYGKALMFFHMLRRRMGDAAFVSALRGFYRDNLFRLASFGDLREAFERASGMSLKTEFHQWVDRTGAPALRLSRATARRMGHGFLLTAKIEQVQQGAPYTLRVPVAVHMEGKERAHETVLFMREKEISFGLYLPARPVRLEVDPEFDLFRRLHREEIPPALSGAFGAEHQLVLLPRRAPEALRAGYRALAERWRQRSPSKTIEIAWDDEFENLPQDRAVWILGWENKHRAAMERALAHQGVLSPLLRLNGKAVDSAGRSTVLAARNPRSPGHTIVMVATRTQVALPGLARKLPHYGRYSYLLFEGDEPTNIVKGQWPVGDSPLSLRVRQADGHPVRDTRGSYAPRKALTETAVGSSR